MTNKYTYIALLSIVLLSSCRKHVDLNQETSNNYTNKTNLKAVHFKTEDGVYYSETPRVTGLLVDDNKLYMSFSSKSSDDFGLCYMTANGDFHKLPLPYADYGRTAYHLQGVEKFGSSIYTYGRMHLNLTQQPVKHAFKYTPGDASCSDIEADVDYSLSQFDPDKSILSLHEYQGNVLGVNTEGGYFCLNNTDPNAVSIVDFGTTSYYDHFKIINDTLYSFVDDFDYFAANPTPFNTAGKTTFNPNTYYGVFDVLRYKSDLLAIGNFFNDTENLAKLNYSSGDFDALNIENPEKIETIQELHTAKVLNGDLYISGYMVHNFASGGSTPQNCLIKYDGEKFTLIQNNLKVLDLEFFNDQLYLLAFDKTIINGYDYYDYRLFKTDNY